MLLRICMQFNSVTNTERVSTKVSVNSAYSKYDILYSTCIFKINNLLHFIIHFSSHHMVQWLN